ncbi:MarR family transcriptional regulator [uncultured Sulfitobacter sp.]|uniref:MarR family winged helix-turn-helix transcriptional regulator n=1 Tax=uncultured Sulfitobacter sp. TaxID=191468 RepID=UPI00262B1054|nr:MarR family transcriptional regulator [uncultured Sulfitobacter sp.]
MTFEYETKLHHWVNRVAFQIRAEMQKRIKESGLDISVEEWAMLMILWEDGATPMNNLAEKTLRDRTTVTRLIDRLVTKGLVERVAAPEDRRLVVVETTDRSNDIRGALISSALSLIDETTESVSSEDLATTLQTLRQISNRISAIQSNK